MDAVAATEPSVGGPLAVVDLGSNSARLVVLRFVNRGHFDVLADTGETLRLLRVVDSGQGITQDVVDRVVATLRGFRDVARGAGASETLVVATAAVREALSTGLLVDRIRDEVGWDVRVISGQQEAQFGFLGALHGLPVDHGLLLDVGGGSAQITEVRDRAFVRSWSLPLGALRLSDRFVATRDRPRKRDVRRLQTHVLALLTEARIPRLEDGGRLVGTGGTIRNLAKMERQSTMNRYPVPRLHGFVVAQSGVRAAADLVTSRSLSTRASVPGLNSERADSIVGGAHCVLTVMEHVDAADLLVSGQGMREGVALQHVGVADERLPAAAEVQRDSVRAVASRFSTFDPVRAERRSSVLERLIDACSGDLSEESAVLVGHAATLLDIGRTVDFFNFHRHSAELVASSDLAGFSHRHLAMLSAMLLTVGRASASISTYAPLLRAEDQVAVSRAAALLALADGIERRYPPGVQLAVRCGRWGRGVVVEVASSLRVDVDSVFLRPLEARMRRVFGRAFAVEPNADPAAFLDTRPPGDLSPSGRRRKGRLS
jgi:exopolyphosphatase/guanosine-5'-triphosphate,3'-diphosphate pyrophosphatase